MIGFAVMSFPENKIGGLISRGIGYQCCRWGISSGIAHMDGTDYNFRHYGILSQPAFSHLQMNGTPGLIRHTGTCGFVKIGVYTDWLSDITSGVKPASSVRLGRALRLISLRPSGRALPLINLVCRKLGWVKTAT